MDQQNLVKQALTASVLPGSLWSHFYFQSVILCVFSYTNSILDDNSASLISFQYLPTFLLLLTF
jgi:hypothetical protein